MNKYANAEMLLEAIRARGWTVAVHHDYKSDDDLMTNSLPIPGSTIWIQWVPGTWKIEKVASWLVDQGARTFRVIGNRRRFFDNDRRSTWCDFDPLMAGEVEVADSSLPPGEVADVVDLAAIKRMLPNLYRTIDDWNRANNLSFSRVDDTTLNLSRVDVLVLKAAFKDLKAALITKERKG